MFTTKFEESCNLIIGLNYILPIQAQIILNQEPIFLYDWIGDEKAFIFFSTSLRQRNSLEN